MELDFAPLSTADFPLLYEWLRQPHVARWWTPVPDNENAVVAKYGPSVRGDDPTRLYLIRADTVPIGLIQCYRHADEPDWDRAVGIPDAAGIDYLIGSPAHLGRGLGSAAIGQFTARVFQLYPDISVVVAVPQQDNRGSCRALEKAGFTAVRTGELHTGDPSDEGMSVIYSCAR